MNTLVLAPSTATDCLSGIVGIAADLMTNLDGWGVGLLIFLETIFPPIPSEVILPLAGSLSQQGDLNFRLLVITSTFSAYGGCLLLYCLGAALGLEQSIRWLSKLLLVDQNDFEKAAGWFTRHGKSAVFFGRFIPGVRSLIALPPARIT